MADVLRGTLLVVFIVALAGAIAYVGDRVGHQVGRKRLSLFGIRPRYTSTIVAIGTGMTIALVVTLGALIASSTVKTAFFRLNAINARVTQLQGEADALERQTRRQSVIVGVGDLMNTQMIVLPMNATVQQRYDAVRQFYENTKAYADRTYIPQGLRKNTKSNAAVDRDLRNFVEDYRLTALLSQSPVLLIATADQNLFPNDEVHFQFTPFPDTLLFPRGVAIASIIIPANPHVDLRLELSRLRDHVFQEATKNGMPPQFAQYTVPDLSVAQGNAMQAQLRAGSGNYVLTAVAKENVYPHLGSIPVSVALKKQ